MVQRKRMPAFEVQTVHVSYQNWVERGILQTAHRYLPSRRGPVFIVTQRDIWALQSAALDKDLRDASHVLFLPSGEPQKRLANVEALAEQMIASGGDRSSVVIGFGGGIVTDVAGFLAAIFMRGVPVLQLPTTLLAQVDAAIGGKTGVNLASGKNLLGSFHQPIAVLIDPAVLATLPEREYRAGLFEVIKCAIIRDGALFELLRSQSKQVLAREPEVVDAIIGAAVRIKAAVVSADEREGDLRRILNFGHTVGHAIEAETAYERFLHGEAVAWGMLAAIRLAELTNHLGTADASLMREVIKQYGPLPSAAGLRAEHLAKRLASDKKTLSGQVHFVFPTAIGSVKIVSGVSDAAVLQAIGETLQ